MNTDLAITSVDDAKLISLIARAEDHVVFAAPGVTSDIADALAAACRRLGAGRFRVVLDVDPEVCRLGYGTLDGLKRLQEATQNVHGPLCHEPRLRLGLLVADDRTVVFSPTPLLIEDSPTDNRPNAIEIGQPPAAEERDLGREGRDCDWRIGRDEVRPERVLVVERELAAAPPVKFDLARRVRVFTSRFQFVELEMSGCFMSRKRVRIPAELVGFAQSKDLERKFHAHFDLVAQGPLQVEFENKLITERSLLDQRRRIGAEVRAARPSRPPAAEPADSRGTRAPLANHR